MIISPKVNRVKVGDLVVPMVRRPCPHDYLRCLPFRQTGLLLYAIAFILMTVILRVSNNIRLHKFTGLCAGALVAMYHRRGTDLRDEHEPSADFRLRRPRASLERAMDLFRCTAHRHVVGGRSLSAHQRCSNHCLR